MNAIVNQYSTAPAAGWPPEVAQSSTNPGPIFGYQQAPIAKWLAVECSPYPDHHAGVQDHSVGMGIAKTLLAVLARWDVPRRLASQILGSDRPDFIAELASGYAALDSRDIRDRARLFFDIYEGVYGLLQDPQAERDWVMAPREDLEGQSLLDLMTEGSQRNLIRALAFVDYVNGR